MNTMTMTHPNTRTLALTVLLGCFTIACEGGGGGDDEAGSTGDSDDGTDTGGGAVVDEAAVVADAVGYATKFTKVNVNPIASAHAGGIDVNIWVKPPIDSYRSVNPESPAAISFAPDTLIVKEHLDGMGAPTGMTIMFKAQGGYDPTNNDWWWAAADLEGNVMASGPGLADCVGCHTDVALTDFVYGVPAANQVP